MKLWHKYLKFVDRRISRYGFDADGYAEETAREVREANYFDFTEGQEVAAVCKQIEEYAGGILHPEEFFLPFETCAAEFNVVTRRDDLARGAVSPMTPVVLLIGRPPGHTVGFGDGTIEWPCMLAVQPPTDPSIIRICKVVLRAKVQPVTGSDSWPDFATISTGIESRLFSYCDYIIQTGKCVSEWRYDFPLPREGAKRDLHLQAIKELDTVAQYYASIGMNLFEQANSPANWVVRVTDEKARKVKRKGLFVEEKRTRLIVVPDRTLDKVLRQPSTDSEGLEKTPHRRRAHYRRLTSPRYRLKRGQRVYVREAWVGPTEATRNGEHYEVLTSLPSREGSVLKR